MIANDKIKPISVPKDYYSTRMALTDHMHLFFLYDANDKDGIDFWSDYLLSLVEKFGKFLNVSTVSSELKDLVKIFTDGKDTNVEYPSIILAHPHLTEPQMIIGISPVDLYSLVEKFYNFYLNDFEKEKEEMFKKIKEILDSFPIVVFIKGVPQDPFCKFSKKFIELINSCWILYKAIDIFQDEKLRCYLRLYSGWKTYPQLYINGKIIGGVDKLTELLEKKEFMGMVPPEMKMEEAKKKVDEEMKKPCVVVSSKSDKAIEVLKSKGANFGFVDIEDIREGGVIKRSYNVQKRSFLVNGVNVGDTDVVLRMFLEQNEKR